MLKNEMENDLYRTYRNKKMTKSSYTSGGTTS